jgi:hypothetical protein
MHKMKRGSEDVSKGEAHGTNKELNEGEKDMCMS